MLGALLALLISSVMLMEELDFDDVIDLFGMKYFLLMSLSICWKTTIGFIYLCFLYVF